MKRVSVVTGRGPLRKCTENPRYFTDDTGKAIYLAGAHTWQVLQDHANQAGQIEHPFNYSRFIEEMENGGLNFLRMWTTERAFGGVFGYRATPFAYQQVGEQDGHPLYDLTLFNQEYFDRLRQRIIEAGEHGIYTAVMLFDGWSVDTREKSSWEGHPYNIRNNINGIDGNPDTGAYRVALSGENDVNPFSPKEHILVHTLEVPAITALQKAYVKKVIETINDLDCVLYEICNEALRWSRYWQYEMVDYIHKVEAQMPKQHPVWMSHVVPAQNETLLVSHAEAISPGEESTAGPYCVNPPASDGSRVIIADTDHLGGIWGTPQWVWKSFTRGLNTLFMDPYDRRQMNGGNGSGVQMLFGRAQYALPEDWQAQVRKALGQTSAFARRINLSHMTPDTALSSTGYCLSNPNEEYLIYQPECGQFKIRLYGAPGPYTVEWFDPWKDELILSDDLKGGTAIDITPPFHGEAVLHLIKCESASACYPVVQNL